MEAHQALFLIVVAATACAEVDDIAPAAIEDLRVLTTGTNELELVWTAPGDDGQEGTVSRYSLWVATEPIQESHFKGYREVLMNAASTAGHREQWAVDGLQPATTYYVVARSYDEAGNASGLSNIVQASTGTATTSECISVPEAIRPDCIDFLEQREFLEPFFSIMQGREEETPASKVARFVDTPVSELYLCPAGEGEYELAELWTLWGRLFQTLAVYQRTLAACTAFQQGPGIGFAAHLEKTVVKLEDCLISKLYPNRTGYVDALRASGNLGELMYFIAGLRSPELAQRIPARCAEITCVAESLYGSRAEAILRVYRNTGYVLQDWTGDYEEVDAWTLDDIELVETVLEGLLDCREFGEWYRFDFYPARHLRVAPADFPDAGANFMGVTISRYFMYDEDQRPTPNRLIFVLGHELSHVATDELGLRNGFDAAVFSLGIAPDPDSYVDPSFIDEATQIANLGLSLVLLSDQPRSPQVFLEDDLASGRLNAMIFSQPRSLPFIRNPPVVSVSDPFAQSPRFADGLIRSENARSYREILADLIIGYRALPQLFFHEGRLLAPRSFFFVRDNYFMGRDPFGLTQIEQAEVDRFVALNTVEARQTVFQEQAATLRQTYCAQASSDCRAPAPPVPETQKEALLFSWLETMAVSGRENRLEALQQILDQAGVVFVAERSIEEEVVNLVVRLGQGERLAMLGGHWDGFRLSRGAIDNASGVVVLAALAMELQRSPPAGVVEIVFFDREEEGLIGSQAFVTNHREDLPTVYLNLDMCGYGDTILVGPVDGGNAPWVDLIEEVSGRTGQLLERTPFIPGGSDHESFQEFGVPAVSLSMFTASDVDIINRWMNEDFSELPSILATIHTQHDRSEQIDPSAMAACLAFLTELVQAL